MLDGSCHLEVYMAKARQIIYRYKRYPSTDEVEIDVMGEIPIPTRDEIFEQKGKSWKVLHVNEEVIVSNPPTMPIFRIYLTDQF
jgi:hypothetical protein